MPESRPDVTAMAIVRTVEDLLGSPKGIMTVLRQNELASELSGACDSLAELRASLRRRAQMQFYVSASSVVSSAKRGALQLSVRANGVECGTVRIVRRGPTIVERVFTLTDRDVFSRCRYEPPLTRSWNDPEVAKYIERSAEIQASRPEAAVEASFLSLLGRGERALERPVCLAGCPLQIPLPISASGEEPVLSPSGHLDVLARLGRGGKGLRLYELKRPGASVAHALDQAVAYAAALRVLLTQEDQALPWWRIIGFGSVPRRFPALQAATLVQDSPKNRETVGRALERLSREADPGIKLGAYYYSVPPLPFRVFE